MIGLLAGHLAHDLPTAGVSPALQAGGPLEAAAVSANVSEEKFLGRLELAIDGAGGSALRPLHELTPLVWEVTAP